MYLFNHLCSGIMSNSLQKIGPQAITTTSSIIDIYLTLISSQFAFTCKTIIRNYMPRGVNAHTTALAKKLDVYRFFHQDHVYFLVRNFHEELF